MKWVSKPQQCHQQFHVWATARHLVLRHCQPLCFNVLFVSLFVSMFYFSPTRLPYSGDLILNFSIDLSFETLGVVYRWSECRQWWWSVACEVIWKWMWGVNEWLGSVMPSWYIEFTFGILTDLDSKIVGSGPWPVAMTFFHFNFTFFGVWTSENESCDGLVILFFGKVLSQSRTTSPTQTWLMVFFFHSPNHLFKSSIPENYKQNNIYKLN